MDTLVVVEIMLVVVRFFWDSSEGKSNDRPLELSRTQLGKKEIRLKF